MQNVSRICIHREPRHRGVDYGEIGEFVRELAPWADVELKPPLLEYAILSSEGRRRHQLVDRLAAEFAAAKVRDLDRPVGRSETVLAGEVDYERRRLSDTGSLTYGLLYDAHFLSELYAGLMEQEDAHISRVTVVITNQLAGTWDENDCRYHARAIICGSPAVLSLSGLVTAPARSRDYYLARQTATSIGLDEQSAQQLAGSFADDFLEYDDSRMTEVVKGYILQAVAYRMTGEAFCGDSQCRLYNAHRQNELLEAQLSGNDFCTRHEALFGTVKDGA